jgi:lysylphosphatidylglycerol synthetase-like protein (DUF2156 family)
MNTESLYLVIVAATLALFVVWATNWHRPTPATRHARQRRARAIARAKHAAALAARKAFES